MDRQRVAFALGVVALLGGVALIMFGVLHGPLDWSALGAIIAVGGANLVHKYEPHFRDADAAFLKKHRIDPR